MGPVDHQVSQQQANSPATGQPTISGTTQVGQTLEADTSGIADDDGISNAVFTYQWLADDTDISGATGSTYTLVSGDQGKSVKVRVSFTDDEDHDETLTSAATEEVASRPNTPATGLPTIVGTAQVGETLTSDTSGIADADELSNVSYSYQWVADDSDISGATGSSYTLTASEEGQIIKVRVSFTDDQGNNESLTSAATAAVTAPPPSLTVSLENAATSHNGTDAFTFELRFSEDVKLRLQDPAGPFVHGDRGNSEEGEADGAGQQRTLADNGRTGFRRRRNRGPARDHGLHGHRSGLHSRRRDALQPAGSDRLGSGWVSKGTIL